VTQTLVFIFQRAEKELHLRIQSPGIDKRIILKRILNKENGSGRLSSDSQQEQGQTPVSVEMSFWVT